MNQKKIEKIKSVLQKECGDEMSTMLAVYDKSDDTAVVVTNGEYEKIAEAMFYTIASKSDVGKALLVVLKDVLYNISITDDEMADELYSALSFDDDDDDDDDMEVN